MNVWLYAETPVFTAALIAAFGWWVKIQHTANVKRDETLSTQSQALAVLVESIRPIREWQLRADQKFRDYDHIFGRHETRLSTLSETTAVLAATLEHHQDWLSRDNHWTPDRGT